MLYDPKNLKILGAQAVGQEGTEKRIDVIATAMKMWATVLDLQDFELCYAPPFSSAKDPVNVLSYIAENIIDGVYQTAEWHEIDKLSPLVASCWVSARRVKSELVASTVRSIFNWMR